MITRFDKIYGCFILLLLSCFIVSNAIAADKIGAIAAVIGTVSIERNGEVVKVKPGSAVFENDKILTGKSSRAQVLLMDQTAINIGQKAELVLDKFVFNSQDDEVALKVTKGTFRFISGKVATKTPEKVNVETPVATIGVRGTEFVGQIGSADTTVALLNGRIEVANDISTQFVTNPGFGVTIDPTSGVISPPVKIPQAELEAVLNSVSTDRDALLEEEIEGGPGPDDEGGPGPDDEGGPGPDDEGGPGSDDGGGPGPDGDAGPGPDGDAGPGPGPDGDAGPGPDGEFGPGPDGEFGPGPDGEFGPGPDGEFGPVPGGDPLDFATGGEDFAGGPDGDFGPSPGGPGFDDFGPAPGGPGFDDFGPGPGGPGFDDFGPAPGGPGFDDFGSGPGGPPPMDLFYAGDPNMAPEGTFVFGDGFFEAGGDPFFVGIPGPDQYGPDGSFDQFGPGPGPGTGGDFGPAPNSLDPGSVPPPGPGGDFGPGPGGPGYDDFGPGPGGPGFDDFGFGPGPGGPGFDDFGFGPGPGGPG
ncbi:MAG: FecR family protein, partial [Proteobacteria bacterium]|nr:FecR family protein [Pseudomonadota bacterium]